MKAARTAASVGVAGRPARRPRASVQTATGAPVAAPGVTRTWPVRGEPSAAVQRTSAQTRSPPALRAPERPGACATT
ncbi:hypothetical protein ABZ847_10750 [Streptomyces bauhiniae]